MTLFGRDDLLLFILFEDVKDEFFSLKSFKLFFKAFASFIKYIILPFLSSFLNVFIFALDKKLIGLFTCVLKLKYILKIKLNKLFYLFYFC